MLQTEDIPLWKAWTIQDWKRSKSSTGPSTKLCLKPQDLVGIIPLRISEIQHVFHFSESPLNTRNWSYELAHRRRTQVVNKEHEVLPCPWRKYQRRCHFPNRRCFALRHNMEQIEERLLPEKVRRTVWLHHLRRDQILQCWPALHLYFSTRAGFFNVLLSSTLSNLLLSIKFYCKTIA